MKDLDPTIAKQVIVVLHILFHGPSNVCDVLICRYRPCGCSGPSLRPNVHSDGLVVCEEVIFHRQNAVCVFSTHRSQQGPFWLPSRERPASGQRRCNFRWRGQGRSGPRSVVARPRVFPWLQSLRRLRRRAFPQSTLNLTSQPSKAKLPSARGANLVMPKRRDFWSQNAS